MNINLSVHEANWGRRGTAPAPRARSRACFAAARAASCDLHTFSKLQSHTDYNHISYYIFIWLFTTIVFNCKKKNILKYSYFIYIYKHRQFKRRYSNVKSSYSQFQPNVSLPKILYIVIMVFNWLMCAGARIVTSHRRRVLFIVWIFLEHFSLY